MTNEQRISQAVDLLTVVIEDERESPVIRAACDSARDDLLNALLDVRSETAA